VTLSAEYTRWRRGVLWLAALVLGATTAQELWNQVPGAVNLVTEGGIPALITAQTILLLALTALGVVALAYSVIRWDDLPVSGRSVRIAWHLFYTVPLATYLIPWAFVVPVTDEDVAAVADELISGLTGITPSAFGLDIGVSDVRDGLGLVFALYAVFAFGPRLLALLPAILRSAAAIKVMIPTTSHPGWAASMVAPSYALVVAVGFVGAIQLAWSWQLVVAMAAFLLAALMWVRRGGELSVPMDRATAVGLVDRIRREWTVLSGIGVVTALWAFTTLPNVDPLAASRFMGSYIGNTLFITVLVADLMIRRLPDSALGSGEPDGGIAMADLRRSMRL
jgi:hypothetical protein